MSDEITLTPLADEQHGRAKSARAMLLGDLVQELVADARAAVEAAADGRARGPITGLPPLDRALNGCLRPGLHGISGDPGSGKTSCALQIAWNCGAPVVYVTAEQGALELFRRVISQTTTTPLDEVRAANPRRIAELAEEAAGKAPMVLLLDATSGPAHIDQLEHCATILKRRFPGSHHLLYVIDALQPWSRNVKPGQEYETIQAGLSELVGLTNRMKAPAIVLSHRNRASAGASGPNMTAAKGSADWEHMGETIIHLSRAKEELQDRFANTIRVELGIAKNRHGQAGFSLPLDFDPRTQRFLIVPSR